VNYWGFPNPNDTQSQIVRPGATVGPGIVSQRAYVVLQPTAIPSTSATIGSATAIPFNSNSGPSNATIVAISAVAGLSVLLLLYLAQKFLRRGGARRNNNPKHVYSIYATIGGIFMQPVIVAILAGATICALATQQSWQEDIIRRWDSPNSVLRVVQVLSLIVRFCATLFGWSFVVDVGWLIMSHGGQPSQMMRTLDMVAVGGSYL
jgi:hypothetical protein